MAYYGHIVIGLLAFLGAVVALSSRKGGPRHRWWGYVYMAAVAVVCITAAVMLWHVFIPPLFMAVITAVYAISGAWLALRPKSVGVLAAEAALSALEIIGLVLFLRLSFAAVAQGIVPPFAPYVIAAIPVILLLGDANWFLRQKDRRKWRIARHLNRMVWGLVVVVRAPLVEVAAAGLPISQPATIVGPILVGVIMLIYFQRRHGSFKGR